jgi:F-type H+-transporting ATPase subunit a
VEPFIVQMDKVHLAGSNQTSIGSLFGSDHPFFIINVDTILNTWLVIALIFGIAYLSRWIVHRTRKPPLLFATITVIGEALIDACTQAIGFFSFSHIVFASSLFIFIFLCNTITVIPWLEEPTVDINTTLALSLLSFLYAQAVAIYSFGVTQYIKNYLSPVFFMLPLNIISKMTSIVSMALRLCGNIFAGAIIISIALRTLRTSPMFEFAGLLTGFNLIITFFFIFFEGTLQAFIFSTLSLTYIAGSLQREGGH